METENNLELFESHFVLFNRVDNPVDDTGLGNYFKVVVIECPEKVETRDHA